jgi:hypothetical protein
LRAQIVKYRYKTEAVLMFALPIVVIVIVIVVGLVALMVL